MSACAHTRLCTFSEWSRRRGQPRNVFLRVKGQPPRRHMTVQTGVRPIILHTMDLAHGSEKGFPHPLEGVVFFDLARQQQHDRFERERVVRREAVVAHPIGQASERASERTNGRTRKSSTRPERAPTKNARTASVNGGNHEGPRRQRTETNRTAAAGGVENHAGARARERSGVKSQNGRHHILPVCIRLAPRFDRKHWCGLLVVGRGQGRLAVFLGSADTPGHERFVRGTPAHDRERGKPSPR